MVGNRWEPFTQSATNDKGDKAYLVNNKWVIDELAAEAEPAAAAPTPPAAAPATAAPTAATPAAPTAVAAPPAATPKATEPPGVLSRAADAIKGTVTGIFPALAEKVTPYKSVLEAAPDAAARQAEVDKRASYGAGPISKETLAKADLVRSGRATSDDPRVNRIAQEMANRKETNIGGLLATAKRDQNLAEGTETFKRQQFAEENPLLGSLAAGSAGMVSGAVNIPSVAADAFNQTFVNPVLRLAGLKPLDKVPTAFGTEYLGKSAQDFMPKIGTRSIEGAWSNEEFAPWLMSKLAANSPQMATQLAAAFVPPLRAILLPGMGGTAAGQSYTQGDDSRVAITKGAIEIGTEMLPLKVFDKVGDLFKGLSVAKQNTILAIAGQRLAQTAGEITAFQLTNAVEETIAQFGGNVLDKYFQGKDIELSKGLVEAAVLGAATGVAMGAPRVLNVARGAYDPNVQIARAIEQNVADTQFTGTDQAARTLLSADTYDARLISPMMTSDPSRVLQSTSVDEAVTSANDLAGSLEITPGPIEPTFDANAPTGALGPSGPTLGPNGLVDVGPSGPTLDLSTPTVPGPDGPSFDGNVPDALLGPSGPTLDTLAPAGAVPPTLPRLAERTSDSDLLARVTGQVPELGALTAPRPQKIQGVAVSQLSDGQLETITADENVPAITRRGALIELTARQTEAAGTTPATGLTNATSVTLPDAAATQDTGSIADKTLTLPATPMRGVPPTSMGGVADGDAARAAATESLGRWATSTNQVSLPAVFNAPTPEAATAVAEIAEALGTQFKGRLFAYNDNRANSLNGIAIGRVAFVNTGSVDINIARTSLHEFHHTVEQIANMETKQGLTNTPAQKYVANMKGIFAGINDAGKRLYVSEFLHDTELAAIADPVAREQRLQELVASPVTESEMVADFLGNRGLDKEFLLSLAEADSEGFKGFVDKWISIIDNLLAVFQGRANQGSKESARVDAYVKDLKAMKVIARDALVEYSKGVRDGSTSIATGEGVSEPAASARPVSSGDGGGQAPEYGTARKGAISVLGRHYSAETRSSLSGAFYGSGLKGAERDRLDGSPDPRLKNRIYFYVDQGSGIRPESGVGGIAHEVQLNNIYDPKTQLLPVKGNFNAFESSVINSGFDGYIAPFGNNQSAVVLLGPRHLAVPVRPLGRVAGAPAPVTAEPTTLKKGLLSKELEAIEATRVPGARLRNGNLEIPATSRDAANAEMERIGSDVRFSKKAADLETFRDVAKSLGLSEEQYNASVLGLMTGKTKDAAFEVPRVGGIPEVVQWLDQRYRDAGMPVLDLKNAEDRSKLAHMLAGEAVGAIRSAGNAVEWYDETVAKTLRVMAVKYPELNTDPNARNAFLMAVAISSQTMNVEDNLRYASSQYEAFRQSQQFPEVGTGKSAPAMAKNFALANRLLRELGPVDLRRFLQTSLTKRELESMGFKIGGESMGEKILGSAVFGPKIGFGFYSNLTGNFEPVTMDMWFMRTIGRLSGTLPAFDPVLFPKQVAKLRAALAETGDANRGVYAANFDPADVTAAQESDAGAIALARKIFSLHNRQFIKERAAFDSGARIKTALVGASGSIIKSADKPTDAPGSGGERQLLRSVVREMVDLVEKQTGKRVPPAALQALIWYPEQELYKKLGVKLRVTSQDYAGAAQSLLKKEGFDGKRISAAAKSGPRQAQPVAGKQNARAARSVSGAGQRLDAFQGQERTNFIQGKIEQTLNSKANATPLADLFAGLEKRGLAKTKTEGLVNRRPDAAGIRYIQDNFLDILDELDTAGKVEINCK